MQLTALLLYFVFLLVTCNSAIAKMDAHSISEFIESNASSPNSVTTRGQDGLVTTSTVTVGLHKAGEETMHVLRRLLKHVKIKGNEATVGVKARSRTVRENIIASKNDLADDWMYSDGDVTLVSIIKEKNGILVAIVLEESLSDKTHRKLIKTAIKYSLMRAVDDDSIDRTTIAIFIYRALTSIKGAPVEFAKILSLIATERSCPYIQSLLREAEDIAVMNGDDDAFLAAVHQEKALTQCIYPLCDIYEPCCVVQLIKSNLCDLCPYPGLCKFQHYGDGITSVLARPGDNNSTVGKCACGR